MKIQNIVVCLLCTLIFSIPLAHADLGRLKRSILRDCSQAEDLYKEISDTPERKELIRYLSEVFRLNLGATMEAPLVAGNLADPSDIWRSLSGESEVASKQCALKLARVIGPEAIDALSSAAPLLALETTPKELKQEIVSTIAALISTIVPVVDNSQKPTYRYNDLRKQLRKLLTHGDGNDPVAIAARMLLFFAWDGTVLGVADNANANAILANSPTALPLKNSERRIIYRELASAVETERSDALAKLSSADLKSLEGFRTTAPRPERIAASLAIAHLGGGWLLDNASAKMVDCGFVASFLPLQPPTEAKKRDDLERLVARCILVGRDEFLRQLTLWPEMMKSPAITAVMRPKISSTLLSTADKLTLISRRVIADGSKLNELDTVLRALFN